MVVPRKATADDVNRVIADIGKTPMQRIMDDEKLSKFYSKVAEIEAGMPEQINNELTATGKEIADLRKILDSRISKAEKQIARIERILSVEIQIRSCKYGNEAFI
jgi:hypothetical protein